MRMWVTVLFMLALLLAFPPESADAVETARAKYEWSSVAEYPKFGREDIDDQIGKWLSETILSTTEYVEEAAELDLEENGWGIEFRYNLHYPSQKAVSVAFEVFTHARGAAHPLTSLEVLNFSTATGKKLELYDLFREPKKALEIFAANAKALIEADLAKNHPENFPEGFKDMVWFEDGFEPDLENYADLILEPDGVRVCFQQYQVLPYVFGISTPLFPLELLEPAGPSRDIWPEN